MPFLDPWTSGYEGIPADTENINLGANRIRDLKVNTRERANVDHSWGDAADNGQHNKVTFNVSTADPAAVSATGYLYTKITSGNTELFWEDQGGHIAQLTAGGSLNFQSFPSGTTMPFMQAAPPTGWTQSAAFNDQVIRLVNGAGGGSTGGSWTISGTSVATTVGSLGASSGSSGSVSGTVAGHAVTAGELPAHTHNLAINTNNLQQNVPTGTGSSGLALQWTGAGSLTTDNGTGGGAAHTHGWSGSISVTTTTTISGAPGASFSNDATWRPAYVNTIVATKN